MGAWIEIVLRLLNCPRRICRTPRWVRGLKSVDFKKPNNDLTSHPTMGAWIEIGTKSEMERLLKVAPHDGCVD